MVNVAERTLKEVDVILWLVEPSNFVGAGEQHIIEQLKKDVDFGFEKAVGERGISAELMAMVVNTWCKILENGLNLDGDDGWYHIKQFRVVDRAYGWNLSEKWESE